MNKHIKKAAYTVEDLISELSLHDLDLPVFVWSVDANRHMPVLVDEVVNADGKKKIVLR